jgi:hypothetical protein
MAEQLRDPLERNIGEQQFDGEGVTEHVNVSVRHAGPLECELQGKLIIAVGAFIVAAVLEEVALAG